MNHGQSVEAREVDVCIDAVDHLHEHLGDPHLPRLIVAVVPLRPAQLHDARQQLRLEGETAHRSAGEVFADMSQLVLEVEGIVREAFRDKVEILEGDPYHTDREGFYRPWRCADEAAQSIALIGAHARRPVPYREERRLIGRLLQSGAHEGRRDLPRPRGGGERDAHEYEDCSFHERRMIPEWTVLRKNLHKKTRRMKDSCRP